MKKMLLIILFPFSIAAIATENNVSNILNGTGSVGDVTIIYYHHNESIPLFLLTVFGKGEKGNLTKAERN